MAYAGLANLEAGLRDAQVSRPVGRIVSMTQGRITAGGLSNVASLGDRVRIGSGQSTRTGEVIGVDQDTISILPESELRDVRIGDAVVHLGAARIRPDASWIGRIVDPLGRPLDGHPLLPGVDDRAIDASPLPAATRRKMGARLETGFCVFNTLLPLVRGQRLGVFAGSGVGKSTLLAGLAQKIDADVIVIALVGERGRELREFVDRVLGKAGMARTVVVAATSDTSASLRRRCAPAAMAIAEHFRDQGRQVLLLTDSITRFAEAHREIALVRGERIGPDGFPASLVTQITCLSERAGPGTDGTGDITAVFTVLVAGADMDGTVADTLRGVLDGHVVLSREIAERGRFPAVDLLRSVSRALPHAADDRENTLIGEARRLIGAYERSELMIQSGLYTAGSDRTIDAAIVAWPKLDALIARAEPKEIADSFVALARCLARQPTEPTEQS